MASKKRAYQDEITRAFIEDMRAVHLGLMDEARDEGRAERARLTRPVG